MPPERTHEYVASEELVCDRSIRLFTFLKELSELRSRTVRNYDQYEHVLWFHEIPRHHSCHCIAWRAVPDDEASDTWVEVYQPRFKRFPDVPILLKGWVDSDQLQNSLLKTPSIRDHIVVEKTATDSGEGDDHGLPRLSRLSAPERSDLVRGMYRRRSVRHGKRCAARIQDFA